jgi:hypothetical protein
MGEVLKGAASAHVTFSERGTFFIWNFGEVMSRRVFNLARGYFRDMSPEASVKP